MTRQITVNSSAVKSPITIDGDLVNIQYVSSDKVYTYRAQDSGSFVTALEQVNADPEGSVGRFLNRSIRTEKTLTEV
jgi:hypothetical protein